MFILKGVWDEIFFDFMFFSQTSYPLAPEHLLGPAKIRGDIHNFVFIASVVDTGYKTFTGLSAI